MESIQDKELEKRTILREYRKLRRAVVPFLDEGDVELIQKAFRVAANAHKDMRRKSGEPYILHPLAVALIVVKEMNLGPTAVAAALLHDVVEDTEATLEDIERDFGKKITTIVDGLTKIKTSRKFDLKIGLSEQTENFKKMILTLSDDVRVILVKLADRLHNMRTLGSMEFHKRLKIAYETIYIYAPLAHRLGLYKIKTELEDLYLKYTKHEVYRSIAEKLNKSKEDRNRFIKEFIAPLKTAIEEAGFKARIFGRPKSIYSIWNKMHKQDVEFEKIYDLFAIRIVIDSSGENEKSDCWRVYSLVTDFYQPNIDRLRDWISNPRANGYESLHTTVLGPEGKWVEVQIRTRRMDEIAEYGYAAHWKYKSQEKEASNLPPRKKEKRGLDEWLQNVRELYKDQENVSAVEFVNAFRNNFFRDEIFAFTPKGDLKKVPAESTVLDFAFEIHSEVGFSCFGAKVNQRLVPLSYEIKNGDQIEIITSKQAKPNADWLRIVKTSKAKSNIKDFLRQEKRQHIIAGKEIIQKKFQQFKIEATDQNTKQLCSFLGIKSPSNMYYEVGMGYINQKQLHQFCKQKIKGPKPQETKPQPSRETQKNSSNGFNPNEIDFDIKRDTLVVGGEDSKLPYSLSPCCSPVPGDEIFGFITINEGVKIHRVDCPNAVEMMSKYSYRVIHSVWKSSSEVLFLVDLEMIGNDRLGIARDVTQAISSNLKVNIHSINMGTTQEGIFEGQIKLYVRDNEHLDQLCKTLREIEGIESIKRHDYEESQD